MLAAELLSLRITNIVKETPDTFSFYIQTVDASAIQYKAGQFLTFVFNINEQEIRRSYSLGSTPGVDATVFFTVKRKANGVVSRLLQDHYNIGDVLYALPAAGMFTLQQPLQKTYVFVAAGSGITPVFALIKQLLFFTDKKVLLINQNIDEANVIYYETLKDLLQQFSERFHCIFLFSRHQHSSKRLNNILFEQLMFVHINNTMMPHVAFYLCGPIAFMRMAQYTLKLLGYADDQIRKEQFVIETKTFVPLLNDVSIKHVTVHFKQKQFEFDVQYPQSILDAALSNNINLPYSCKAGICSTCTANCLQGNVVMNNNDVLTDNDITKGLVLTCVGYAATDIVLQFD